MSDLAPLADLGHLFMENMVLQTEYRVNVTLSCSYCSIVDAGFSSGP